MRTFATTASLAAMTAAILAGAVQPAYAACTRLAFSVNDYGKDGPTQDAKKLLDTYIAKWAAERGIKAYRTGKKDVSCELFLNLIVFDEHTCKAEATVCWDGPPVAPQSKPGQAGAEGGAVAPAAPKASSTIKRAVLPAGVARPSPAVKPAAEVATPPAQPAAAKVAPPAAVETGAVVPAAKPVSPPADVPAKPAAAKPAAEKSDGATDQALQAAQRAAAAAERAAAAAERAAAAAAAAEKGAPKP